MEKRSKIRGVVFVVGLAVLTAGCLTTKTVWRKPGVDQDQWAVDNAACRSRARRLADRDYAADDRIGERGGVQDTAAFNSSMRIYAAEQNRQSIYHRCLQRKGYRRVKPEPASANKA